MQVVDKLLIAMWILWGRKMKRTSQASIFITIVSALNSFSAFGQVAGSRCVADLGRVDANFCLSRTSAGLTYQWKADDDRYDLIAKACVANDQGLGSRRDTIFALDRSQNIWATDSLNKKLGADQITVTASMLEKLRAEAKANPAVAPKIGVMMFSNAPSCTEYSGGAIAVNRSFPCLYVKAGSLADDAHYGRLAAFLKEADGKYAQGGDATTSDFTIVANILAANSFGLASTQKAGLVMMSDARSFKGAAADPYPYLRIQSYTAAQNEALNAFSVAALKNYQLLFAYNPKPSPVFSDANAYDNMCQMAGATPADCASPVVIDTPATWPVNGLDPKVFVASLAAAVGTPAADAFFEMKDKPSFEAAMERLRIVDTGSAVVTSVSYRINGGAAMAGTVDGARLTLAGLPVGQENKIDLVLKVGTGELTIPLTATTEKIASDRSGFQDKEMFCAAAIAPATEGPHFKLKNLQGGSGSCGAVSGAARASAWTLVFLFGAPILVLAVRGRRKAFVVGTVMVATCGIFSADVGHAAEAKGLNALNYRPVVDGVATSEKASVPDSGSVQAGLFMDYANDAIELAGDDGKRLGSVADNLTTAHVMGNLGLFGKLAVGVHVPLVYRTDLNRRVSGRDDSGEKAGELSDPAVFMKYALRTDRALSLALMPMVTIPAGKPEDLTGDGVTNFGGLLVFSGAYGDWAWASNLGYMHREKALVLADDRAASVTMNGQYQLMTGLEYRLFSMLSLGGGVQFKPSAGESIDFAQQNPAEWTMVAKFRPLAGALEAQTGFGTGIGRGLGSPDYRIYAGISYCPAAGQKVLAEPPRKVASK